jgi:hypothetical protein
MQVPDPPGRRVCFCTQMCIHRQCLGTSRDERHIYLFALGHDKTSNTLHSAFHHKQSPLPPLARHVDLWSKRIPGSQNGVRRSIDDITRLPGLAV